MKLRALELTNVRRFAGQVARVGQIGDGVSVLSAPNETGKSTLFDALAALMFERHTGRSKALRSLQPHSGGAVGVLAEVELDTGLFRIEKRWLGKAAASISDAQGRLIAQADEAEGWIDAHLGARLGGPSGLLWVRQGAAGLEAAGTLEARRDILSQVAGEIDAMTGGRRMDAVRTGVEAALAPLVTATGRAKAGGPWDAAQKLLEGLGLRESELLARLSLLTEALTARRRAERARRDLDDPEAEAARAARLKRARTADEAARAHARRLTAARREVDQAQAVATAARGQRDRLRSLATEAEQAALDLSRTERLRRMADEAESAARAVAQAASDTLDAARVARDGLRLRLQAADRHAQARAARDRLTDLSDRLKRAEAAQQAAAQARADRAALPVTAALLEAARAADATLSRLQTQAEAQAVTLRFDHSGAGRVLRAGAPVDGVVRLDGPAVFDLPGLGRLSVDPGARAGSDLPARLAGARRDLEVALAACGAATLADATAAQRRAAEFEQAAVSARNLGDALAPEGLEALRAAVAQAQGLAASGTDDDDTPDRDALSAGLHTAERHAEAAEIAERAASRDHARDTAAQAAARATEAATATRAQETAAARGDMAEHMALLAGAEAADTAARAERARAEQARADLAAAAPDAETVAAALAQAQGAVDAAARDRARLETELAELRGQIGTLAAEGIEEDLAAVQGGLGTARARAAALGAEVAALIRLRAALDSARGAAREAYFQPVAQELVPLLALIHPGAELALDDASLLPSHLTRDGQPEGLDILSGGTREQIAVLTRLAFARLFARQGRAVPVILDDALVQTDDDRIEAMFTALHRTARDQQVIVLTCRQRAFAALGGQRLTLEVRPA